QREPWRQSSHRTRGRSAARPDLLPCGSQMPNWLYLLDSIAYHLGLALWIGGAIVLGALVAPALFGAMPRQEAGAIFGPILRKFARLRLGAIALVIVAAAVKHLAWETHASTVWILIRWIAIAFMA